MKNSLPPRPFALRARKILSTLIQPAVLGLLLAHAQAGNTWDGGGGDANWGTPANWSPDGAPGYGTLTFSGSTQTTNNNNSITAMNQVNWNGASAWVMNGSTTLSLFDNGGTQAKLESLGTGGVTINANITFAATTGAAWGEINAVAVNSGINFASGTLTVNGSAVAGIRLFSGPAQTVTFANTVNASGKYFAFANNNANIVKIDSGANVTTGDFYVMNSGVLNLNGGTLTTSAVRLGGDFGTTGTQSLGAGGTLLISPATGGVNFSSTINTVSGNTSGLLTVSSQNGSGTNTLTGGIFLDSDLKIFQATGGSLSTSTGTFDVKNRKLTVDTGGTGTVTVNQALSSSFGAGGYLVKEGPGTLVLANTSNSYTGTIPGTLNANGTQIAGGTLAIAGDGSLGVVPSGAYNNVQFTGSGTLQDNGSSVALNANRNISIASGSTATFNSSSGNTFTVNGIVNGSGGLVNVTGAGGTVVLAGNNTYTGATTVSSGTLRVDHNNGLGTTAGATTVNNGASLRVNGVTIAEAISINGSGDGGVGAIVNHATGTSTFSGQVTAVTSSLISAGGGTLNFNGGLVKNGTTLTLSGGAFNINTVGISGASANSDLIVDNASVALNVASTYNGPTTIRNAGTLNANVSNALPNSPRSAMILDATGSGSSTLAIGSGTNNEIASLTGAASSVLSLTSSSSLAIGTGSGTTTFAGTIVGGLGTPITKDGASTQILTGNSSSYQGVFSISGGVLEANNTTGSATGVGGVSVAAAGTLAGTGRIEASAAAGSIFINGNLIVGSTVGAPAVADFEIATNAFSLGTTLSVNSQLTMELFTGAGLGDNSSLSTAADRLKIVGNLAIDPSALFELANPNGMTGWAAGDRWRVFDWSSVGTITGSYAALNMTLPTLGAGLYWDTSDLFTTIGALAGTIDIEAVPEPGSFLVGIFCAASVAMRRRRRQA